MTIFEKTVELDKEGISFVTVTMIDVKGSAPQNLGAKAIVSERGLEAGTVGGGKVEAAAIILARQILDDFEASQVVRKIWNLQKDIGMTCGGEVEFLFEKHSSKSWPVVIFGAGHVAQALSRALLPLKCQISCVDGRKEWVEKLPDGVNAVHALNPEQAVSSFPENAFFISMTKGHASDVPVLKAIADHAPNSPYVGVIGSKVKGDKIKAELQELGVDEDFLDRLRVPVGLPIGNNDPAEIAISIIAELLQVRDA